jgi:CHASE1-domain containing sensor protein
VKAVAPLIVLGIFALVAMFAWAVSYRSGVRRKLFRQCNRELAALHRVIDSIERYAELYPELENPLSSRVKQIIREHRDAVAKQREKENA